MKRKIIFTKEIWFVCVYKNYLHNIFIWNTFGDILHLDYYSWKIPQYFEGKMYVCITLDVMLIYPCKCDECLFNLKT